MEPIYVEWTQYIVEARYGDLWIELPGFSGEDLFEVERGVIKLRELGRSVRILRETSTVVREQVQP